MNMGFNNFGRNGFNMGFNNFNRNGFNMGNNGMFGGNNNGGE